MLVEARGFNSLGSEVRESDESSNQGAGNQAQILCKSGKRAQLQRRLSSPRNLILKLYR